MRCVKEAEERILSNETTKDYMSIQGSAEYAKWVQELVFGPGSPAVADGRTVTAHTPGGTAALRVAADFVKSSFPRQPSGSAIQPGPTIRRSSRPPA